jgi:hypothetical protein
METGREITLLGLFGPVALGVFALLPLLAIVLFARGCILKFTGRAWADISWLLKGLAIWSVLFGIASFAFVVYDFNIGLGTAAVGKPEFWYEMSYRSHARLWAGASISLTSWTFAMILGKAK